MQRQSKTHRDPRRMVGLLIIGCAGPIAALTLLIIPGPTGFQLPTVLMMGIGLPIIVFTEWWRRRAMANEHRLIEALPDDPRREILETGALPFRVYAPVLGLAGGLTGLGTMALTIVPLLSSRSLPVVPSVALLVGLWVLVLEVLHRLHRRRLRLAMRQIGGIAICGRCGYPLQSLDQTCSECGWRDGGGVLRRRGGRSWGKLAVNAFPFLLVVGLAGVLWMDLRPFRPSGPAATAAVSKVGELLAENGIACEPVMALADEPDDEGYQLVIGAHESDGGGAPIAWHVLVDQNGQAVAWHVPGTGDDDVELLRRAIRLRAARAAP